MTMVKVGPYCVVDHKRIHIMLADMLYVVDGFSKENVPNLGNLI